MTPTTKLLELARKAIEAVEALDKLPSDVTTEQLCDAGNAAIAARQAYNEAANPSAIIALVEHCERAEEQRDALLGALKEAVEELVSLRNARWSELECTEDELVGSYRAAIALCEPGEIK